MNTTIPLKEAILKLSRKVSLVLLMFQSQSCELEVIPPTLPNTRSSFEFFIDDPECVSDCNVTFTNRSENADSFEWNFGDGSAPSSLANPTHQYVTPGSYDVTLRAFRETIEHDTTIAVVINASDPGPASTLEAFSHTTTSANISSHITTLDHALTNEQPTKVMVVTSVLGLRNSAALGVYYFGNKWMIFTQNTSSIQPGEIFNVVAADPGGNAFVHQATAANLRTGYISTIDHAATNSNPEARVFVTPIWEQSTDYITHALGVVYVNDRWEIINLDKANLPVGLKFNVIVSSDNGSSFIHTSDVSTITADYTTLDDVKTNNKPGIKIIATLNQGTTDGVISNPRVTGLWYKSSMDQWTVFNENGDNMEPGARFNILAIE